jgi:hypothetical protein
LSIRLLLADDHGVVRKGLRFLIERQPGMEVVGEAADDVLQMCCLGRRSGAIQLVQGSKTAVVFLLNGRIVHAEQGAAVGPDALYEIVLWEAIEFAYDYSVRAPEETVHTPWDEAIITAVDRRKTPVIAEMSQQPAASAANQTKPSRWGIFGGSRKLVL